MLSEATKAHFKSWLKSYLRAEFLFSRTLKREDELNATSLLRRDAKMQWNTVCAQNNGAFLTPSHSTSTQARLQTASRSFIQPLPSESLLSPQTTWRLVRFCERKKRQKTERREKKKKRWLKLSNIITPRRDADTSSFQKENRAGHPLQAQPLKVMLSDTRYTQCGIF